jgi:uncharacterized membrane protein
MAMMRRGWVLLLWVAAAAWAAAVTVTVGSDRLTYPPGAKATLAVTLANADREAVAGTLAVRLVAGLDTLTPVADEPVTVPAQGTLTRNYPVEVGTAQWGRGVEARFTAGGTTTLATHAFTVIVDPFQTAIHGAGLPMAGSEKWEGETIRRECQKLVDQNLATYCNIYEAFAWAPCDYSKMTLDDNEPFHAGQSQYVRRRDTLIFYHQMLHERGIHAISYGKSCGAGRPGVEYGFRHPEQMNVFNPAGFCHEDISVDVLDRMAEGRWDFWQRWISSWTQMGNVDAADFGVDEIARSAKQLGWDGVRYDGHFTFYKNMPQAARLVKHAAERLRGEMPGFGIGYNYFGYEHDDPEVALTDAELASACTGGGLLMSEAYRGYHDNVLANIRHLQSVGDAIRMNGGYFLTIFDGGGLYNVALCYAAGARIMPGGAGFTMFNKFATRFADFVFDPAMRRLQQPERVIAPVGDPGFLWNTFIYERPVSATRSQLVMHLVNVNSQLDFRITQNPPWKPPVAINPPCEQVGFRFMLPAGYRAVRAFVTDDPRDFTTQDAIFTGTTLVVPRVSEWTMVVIDLEKTNPTHTLAESCAIPLRKGTPVTPEVLATVVDGPLESTAPTMAFLTKPPDFIKHADGVDRKDFAGEDAPMALQRNGRVDLHYARGIFDDLNRPWEAVMRLKGCRVTTSTLDNGRDASSAKLGATNIACVTNFPDTDDLAGQDVLVIDNIPVAGFTPAQRHDVLTFVKGGGSLLVLGDWHGLTRGCWEGSFLEEVLPVRVRQADYLLRLQGANQRIAAMPDYRAVLKKAPPEFGPGPVIDWTCALQPRAGAKVLLAAGAQPFLVTGTYGAGRVAVFAGSHSGTPAHPYWQSDAWPAAMGDVLAWLAEPAAAVRPAAQAATLRAQIDAAVLNRKAETTARLLGSLLEAGRSEDALFAATCLLEHPDAVTQQDSCLLALRIVALVDPADVRWRALGEKYQQVPEADDENAPEVAPDLVGKEGVKGSDLLAAALAARTVPGLTADTFTQWKGLDLPVRIWCLGLAGDAAALPYLEKQLERVRQIERKEAVTPVDQRFDANRLPLLRPFLYYALVRCGKRDEATRTAFCRAVLDLPLYNWRQHWIFEQSHDMRGLDLDIGRARLAQATRVLWQCEYAVQFLPSFFQSEVIGADAIGYRAALRAMQETDCQKALPLALDYLDRLPLAALPAFRDLAQAKLAPLRQYLKTRE